MSQTLNSRAFDRLEGYLGVELIPKLAATIKMEIATTVETIHQLLAQSDVAAVLDHAHRIKAGCQTLGLEDLALCFEHLELAARNSDLEEAKQASEQLSALAKAAIVAVNNHLNGQA